MQDFDPVTQYKQPCVGPPKKQKATVTTDVTTTRPWPQSRADLNSIASILWYQLVWGEYELWYSCTKNKIYNSANVDEFSTV